jgi:mono/diheme cytochrome c family protein
MDATVFYIVGLALVAIALVISFVGMRSEKFPSDGVLRIGVVLVAVLVVVTSAAAVSSSQEEAQEREHEENAEAAEVLAEESAENAEEAGGGNASSVQEEPEEPQSGTGDDSSAESGGAGDGAQVFVDNGCGSCHTLAALPEAGGTIGPNLDEALDDQDEAYIRTSIVDPDAVVEEGYPAGVMPPNYESSIDATSLDALVAYLAQATSSSGDAAGTGGSAGGSAGGSGSDGASKG